MKMLTSFFKNVGEADKNIWGYVCLLYTSFTCRFISFCVSSSAVSALLFSLMTDMIFLNSSSTLSVCGTKSVSYTHLDVYKRQEVTFDLKTAGSNEKLTTNVDLSNMQWKEERVCESI